MGSKKILVISKSFYPINGPRSFRTTELVIELARQGHFVTLITPRNDLVHDEFEKQYGIKIIDLGRIFLYKGSNKSLPIWQKAIAKALHVTGLSTTFYFPDVLYMFKTKSVLRKHSNYDLLISVAKPHSIHWGVYKAFKNNSRLTKKWIADCGDPFMGNPFHKRAFFFRCYEKCFGNKVDYITVPIEGARQSYYPEVRKKIRVIPQGFNFKTDRLNLVKYSPNHIPTFAYAGAFYKEKRDPSKLLEFLSVLKEDFKFIIYTNHSRLVTPFLHQAKGKIILKGYIPRENLLKELSQMDFLINICNDSSVQSPSKLIDYYLTGRPVLSFDSNVVDPEVLIQFFEGDYHNKYPFQNMENFNITNVVKAFLSL